MSADIGGSFDNIGGDMSDLVQHEMSGFFSPWFDLELYYDYLDVLIRIQFILRKDVLNFIEMLPNWIRNIKTIVNKNPELTQGRISGKIDWHMTIKTRMAENPLDKTLFVIDRIERNYNIPENLVLKETLSILYSIIFDDLPMAIEHTNKYPSLRRLVSQRHLRETIRDIYLKNIYIRRISLKDRAKINDRIINYTLRSRSPLYREAAKLLDSYRKLSN
jgi:hypothetical protein